MNYNTPKVHILHAALLGYVMTLNLYKMMRNPKNQGPNFKWSNFREMVNSLVSSQLFLSFAENPYKRYKQTLETEALRSANKLLDIILEGKEE